MSYTGNNNNSIGVPRTMFDKTHGAQGVMKLTGLYICKVIDIVDDRYEGFLYVEIIGQGYLGETSSAESRKEYFRVRRASPYGGSYQFANATNTYGFVSHPPAPGCQVLVAFANNSDTGIMLGVLPDTTRNASKPTNPGAFVDSEKDAVGPSLDPSVQKTTDNNKKPRATPETIQNESTEYKDKVSDTEVTKQGIGIDSIRGLSSSSERRESPTNVFGFNTPGGHQFVMDDGTLPNSDTCLTPDKERKGGLSNLFRMRSAGGAQILMHDGTGIVYIMNQNGSSWIQLGSDGKIDIYSEGDISVHTENDYNLQVGGDFVVDADTISMKARGDGGITLEASAGELNVHAQKDFKLTTDLNGNIKCAGSFTNTAALIDLNGPEAIAATKTVLNNLTVNKTVKQSITSRVPEAEPWGGHDEEQEFLPQVASPDSNFTATDIDMSKIFNNQAPAPDKVTNEKTKTNSVNPRQMYYKSNTPSAGPVGGQPQ